MTNTLASQIKFPSHSVHGVHIRDASDQQLLHDLQQSLDLDVWSFGSPGRRDADVMVTSHDEQSLMQALDERGLTHYVRVPDVGKDLELHEEELQQHRASRSGKKTDLFEDYPRYEEVDAYLERVAAAHPDIVTLVNAGNSYEGRPIKYLKISTTNFTDPSKPVYFMDATMHAREWVTLPVALYSIHRLVEDLRDEDRDLLQGIDWVIMPLVNPDGYEFSHTDDRLWRQTRSVNLSVSTTCVGVDANRNFDIVFNTVGVSSNPCAQNYPGVAPFTEVEVQYVRDIMFEHLDRLMVYMDIHSYGNWVLFGYGYDGSLVPEAFKVHHMGAAMGEAMDAFKLPKAPFYAVGNGAILLYPASGVADDYASSIGVPFSFTLELPGYEYFFSVPPQYIAQINRETWPGIGAGARLAKLHYVDRLNSYSGNR